MELGLSESDLLAAIREVAYAAHASTKPGEATDLPRGDLLRILARHLKDDYGKAQRFLQYVDERAGLLVGRGGVDEPVYSFPHRTFQEFLSGCHLALGGRGFGRRLRELLPAGDRWALVARLGAEHLLYNVGDVTKVLDALYVLCPVAEPTGGADWRGIVWSGHIALEVGLDKVRADIGDADGGSAFLSRLMARLVQVAEKGLLAPPERAEIGVVLAHLGDPRPGTGLRPDRLPDIVWCEVPAGRFVMGSDKSKDPHCWDNEMPQHLQDSITTSFLIGKYPVTNAQFQCFVNDPEGYCDDRWWTPAGRKWRGDRKGPRKAGGVFNLPNHPVVMITWYEAVAFCAWLANWLRTSETPLEVGDLRDTELKSALAHRRFAVRLPTEAEWEKAARGTDGRVFPSKGKFKPNNCITDEACIGSTTAVGIFPAGQSPCGAMDMAGNVWEWCQSLYEPYPYRPDDGLEEIEAEGGRMLRGGSWNRNVRNARCDFRLMKVPVKAFTDVGFRVVFSPK